MGTGTCESYDLILIDMKLPSIDGLDRVSAIRAESDVPIILLTSREGPQDIVEALNGGADDCLTKPFSPQELSARIRAVLRRTARCSDMGLLRIGDIGIAVQSRTAFRGHSPIPLTALEFDLLTVLMRFAGRVVSRQKIANLLENRIRRPFDRSIDMHISNLRKKIEVDGQPRIRSIRGVGYLFTLPIEGLSGG